MRIVVFAIAFLNLLALPAAAVQVSYFFDQTGPFRYESGEIVPESDITFRSDFSGSVTIDTSFFGGGVGFGTGLWHTGFGTPYSCLRDLPWVVEWNLIHACEEPARVSFHAENSSGTLEDVFIDYFFEFIDPQYHLTEVGQTVADGRRATAPGQWSGPTVVPAPVALPAPLLLMASGIGAMAGLRRLRRPRPA